MNAFRLKKPILENIKKGKLDKMITSLNFVWLPLARKPNGLDSRVRKKLDWISKSQHLNRTLRCIWKGSHLKGENQILFTSCDEYLKCNTIFQLWKVLRSISPLHVPYKIIVSHFWITKMNTDFIIILNEKRVVLNTTNFKERWIFFRIVLI